MLELMGMRRCGVIMTVAASLALILAASPAAVQAQTRPEWAKVPDDAQPLDVRVTVKFDASEVEPRIEALDARLDEHDQDLTTLHAEVATLRQTVQASGKDQGGDDRSSGMPIGMNLAEPSYWSTNWVYADALLQAARTEANATDDSWLLLWDAPKYGVPLPRRGWTCTGPGRMRPRVEVTDHGIIIHAPDNARELGMHAYWPGVPQGYEGLFHPLYLERLEPFGVLRFMDWQGTNHSPAVTWSDMQARADVPYEHMIRLCNVLDADMWLCMPHLANDDAVRTLAKLVKAKLDPQLKVYVEYSNEVWNAAFGQWKWLRQQDIANGPDLIGHDVWVAEEQRDWAIWMDVFGEGTEGRRDEGTEGGGRRIVRVVAGQAANPWIVSAQLKRMDRGDFDTIAIAPYMHVDHDDLPAGPTAEDLLDRLRASLEGEVREDIEAHAALARQYDVPLIAYEGGQHLVRRDEPWVRANVLAQRSPEMYELYRDYLEVWREAGGGLFCHFNDVRRIDSHGAWGALEFQNQRIAIAPKYRALVEAAGVGD